MSRGARPAGYLDVQVAVTRRCLLFAWLVQLVSILAGAIGYEVWRVVVALMVVHALVR